MVGTLQPSVMQRSVIHTAEVIAVWWEEPAFKRALEMGLFPVPQLTSCTPLGKLWNPSELQCPDLSKSVVVFACKVQAMKKKKIFFK